jgi:hypothetical protein
VDSFDEARDLPVAALLLDRGADIEATNWVWHTHSNCIFEIIHMHSNCTFEVMDMHLCKAMIRETQTHVPVTQIY